MDCFEGGQGYKYKVRQFLSFSRALCLYLSCMDVLRHMGRFAQFHYETAVCFVPSLSTSVFTSIVELSHVNQFAAIVKIFLFQRLLQLVPNTIGSFKN